MFAKFAPSNILENLDKNKKNCLVVVGIEAVQICTIKDDINNLQTKIQQNMQTSLCLLQ